MNKYEVGVLGNARPRPMAARQAARDNPVWSRRSRHGARAVRKLAQLQQICRKTSPRQAVRKRALPASERENVTALHESELFAYGIGQSWVFRFQTRRSAARFAQGDWRYVQYTVRDCFCGTQTQYYAVEMLEEGDAAANTAELTANRLRYLINFYLDRAVCTGERQPLPLPAETVVECTRRSVRSVRRKRRARNRCLRGIRRIRRRGRSCCKRNRCRQRRT